MARAFALVLGAAFLLTGIMGFIRPLTDAGDDGLFVTGETHLLGIFHTNWFHNLVHIVTGLAGIAASARTPSARLFSQVLGVAYAGVFLVGLFTDDFLGIWPLNAADNVLHVVTAAAALVVGFTPLGLRVLGDRTRATA